GAARPDGRHGRGADLRLPADRVRLRRSGTDRPLTSSPQTPRTPDCTPDGHGPVTPWPQPDAAGVPYTTGRGRAGNVQGRARTRNATERRGARLPRDGPARPSRATAPARPVRVTAPRIRHPRRSAHHTPHRAPQRRTPARHRTHGQRTTPRGAR